MNRQMDIVVIENNEDVAERLIKFLRTNFTNNIRHIQDGADAIQFLLLENDKTPKLILLDPVLPSVDGIEVYNVIKSEPKERELSVIFLVSSTRSKEYLESLGILADGYLIKPNSENLLMRIE